jgi:probable HAF family extracellular repeat protein
MAVVFSGTVTDDDSAKGSDSVTIASMDLDPPVPPDPNFIPLGDLPGGGFYSAANGVSDDGSVVVGASESALGGEAFRWTSATGMVGLGDLPGGRFTSGAEAVSADGNVVVGTGWIDDSSHDGDEMSPFRWTSATGMVDLGDLDNCISNWGCRSSSGTDVSADGSVVVGTSNHGFDTREAFRWTSADGMLSIGALPSGRARARAYGVSADGTVIVGRDEVWENNEDSLEAFRWTAATGMVGLGDLPDGRFASEANDVSADGSVIVGVGETAVGGEAVVWTSAGGMVGLGFLPGGDNRSYALGVSADGSMVVGQSELADSGSPSRAFVWTQANGMQSLRDMLIAKDVATLDNWELREARSISANGEWVVGVGLNALGLDEAFLANISVP